VQPGNEVTLVNGAPVRTEVKQNGTSTRLEILGEDFTFTLGATTATGKPLQLSAGGAPVVTPVDRIATSGQGCAPGTTVHLYLLTPLTTLGSIQVNGDGTFSGSVALPAGLKPGDYVVQTNCLTTTSQVRSLSIGLTLRSSTLVLCQTGGSADQVEKCVKVTQKPKAGFLLPEELKAGRNVLLRTRIRMNSGQFARAEVLCFPVRRAAPQADVRYCETRRAGKKTYALIRPNMRLTARVVISAPATSKYAAYTFTKGYTVK
jgi:hypothetical protein